jgi:hypothetical protein
MLEADDRPVDGSGEDVMTQFSLFGAAAAAPGLDDLDGLLLAGGHWVRSAAGARLSIVVDEPWRAAALRDAFAVLGLAGDDTLIETEGGLGVRTVFSPDLVPAALRWTHGANEAPPAGFGLTAGGLRLWAVAAGRGDDIGYLLATAESDDIVHMSGGAQLSRLGVAAVSIGVRGGPGWRITSAKRLRRLAELLGEAPPGAGSDWPEPR